MSLRLGLTLIFEQRITKQTDEHNQLAIRSAQHDSDPRRSFGRLAVGPRAAIIPPPETNTGSKSGFVSERRQGKQRALWHSLAVAG